MAVFRINKTKNYTVISNYHLKDKKLSLKSKGLLSLMLSLPEDWDYSVRGLEKICKESKDTINNILQELEKYNYLKRTRVYCNGKISEWEYNIYEKPFETVDIAEVDLHPKNQDIENQDIENQDINKITKEINTKKQINNKKNKKQTEFDILIDTNFTDKELKNTVYEFIKMRKAIKKPLTTRGLELIINKLNKLTNNTDEKIEILNNSIMNNWQGIFQLNKSKNKNAMEEFLNG